MTLLLKKKGKGPVRRKKGGGMCSREEKVFTKDSIDKKDYWWYLGKTLDEFCL